MSKRSLSMNSFTPTATADAATTLANGTYNGVIQGGSASQRINIIEVMLTGQAGASSPSIMLLARDVVVAATLGATTTNDAPLDSAVAALAAPPLVGNTFTTPPQRSTTAKLLNLAFNAFGGIVRWVAAPGEEITQAGNAVSVGETSLSAFTGGTPGLMGSHIIYEPF